MGAPSHIVLMGMMGAGKTTVGVALAASLGVPYADNDDGLRARMGLDAAGVAGERGPEGLHAIERQVLEEAVRRPDRAVIGAPGSVALDRGAPALLATQHVVWLRARVETLAARVRRDPVRPLLGVDPTASLLALAAQREPGFSRLADVTVDVDGLSVAEVVERIRECVFPE